jgi:hypothetical protein
MNQPTAPYESSTAAQSAADALNAQFVGAGYKAFYIGPLYAKASGVLRGGFYVADPWGKLV